MKNGFTLVELSIVLVIIGLLVGGVLVAQSLIDSVKIQSFTRQIQQYDVAVVNFRTRYKGIPGDSDKINGIGDNDGNIENTSAVYTSFNVGTADINGNPTGRFSGETANFWNDLVITGLKLEGMNTPNTDASSGIVHNEHIPESAFGESGIYVGTSIGIFPGNDKNIYVVADTSTTANSFFTVNFDEGGTNIGNAIAADKKLDDGNAMTGDMLTGFTVLDDNDCSADKISTFGSDRKMCYIFIKLLSQIEEE